MGNREGGAFLGAFPCGKQVEDEVVRVPSEPADRLGTPSTPAESKQETAGEAEVLLEGSTAGRKSQGSPGPRGWPPHPPDSAAPMVSKHGAITGDKPGSVDSGTFIPTQGAWTACGRPRAGPGHAGAALSVASGLAEKGVEA